MVDLVRERLRRRSLRTTASPVDWVLLMGGNSSWNLINTSIAFVVNIVLNLLLIPKFGMVGAAVAWGISIAVNNVAPLIEVWLHMCLHPFGPGFRLIAVAALLLFGAAGLAVRLLVGPSVAGFVAFCVVTAALYLAVLARSATRSTASCCLLRSTPGGVDRHHSRISRRTNLKAPEGDRGPYVARAVPAREHRWSATAGASGAGPNLLGRCVYPHASQRGSGAEGTLSTSHNC